MEKQRFKQVNLHIKRMKEYKNVSWRDIPGNKYSKSVDAAMLSEQGYIAVQRVRHCHSPKPELCNVFYDRSYVIQFLIKRFLFQISIVGKGTIHKLIDEAWDELHDIEATIETSDNLAS